MIELMTVGDRKYPPRVKGRPRRFRVWGLGLDPGTRRGGGLAEVEAEDRRVDRASGRRVGDADRGDARLVEREEVLPLAPLEPERRLRFMGLGSLG